MFHWLNHKLELWDFNKEQKSVQGIKDGEGQQKFTQFLKLILYILHILKYACISTRKTAEKKYPKPI